MPKVSPTAAGMVVNVTVPLCPDTVGAARREMLNPVLKKPSSSLTPVNTMGDLLGKPLVFAAAMTPDPEAGSALGLVNEV